MAARCAVAVAVLLAALAGCGGDSSSGSGGGRPAAIAERPARPAAQAPQPRSHRLRIDDRGHPIVWVKLGKHVDIRTGPGGGELLRRVDAHTEFGSRRVFSVVRTQNGWAGVSTPFGKNGALGWVKLDSRVLRSGWVANEVVVDLSAFRAELLHGDEVVRSFPVTVGAPESPTPTGRFAVTDTFRGDLNAAYGCCAVALSAIQPALPSGWLGGNRIAIHGTAGLLGVAASHGCVRAADPDVNALVKYAPPGTPVIIHE